MSKPNGMASFLAKATRKDDALVVTEPTEATRATEQAPSAASTEARRRGRGRPRKSLSGDMQATTIRMSAEDHIAVRTLALHDRIAMNDLVFRALKDYCRKRGVKIGEGSS